MSLTRVAVDIGQLLLNQLATAPPHKAPQEGRFKTRGETIFGLAPVIFWVRSERVPLGMSAADIMPLASEAATLHRLRSRVSDHRTLPHPPIFTKLAGAHFVTFLPFFLAYG